MKKKWIETDDFETFSKNYDEFITQVVSGVDKRESYLSAYLRDEFGEND